MLAIAVLCNEKKNSAFFLWHFLRLSFPKLFKFSFSHLSRIPSYAVCFHLLQICILCAASLWYNDKGAKENWKKSVRTWIQIRCGRWNSAKTQNSTDSWRRIEKIIHKKCVLFTEDFHQSWKLVFHSSAQFSDDERQRSRFIQIKMLIMRLNLISRKIGSESAFFFLSIIFFLLAEAKLKYLFKWSKPSHVAVMIFQSIGWFKWHNKLFHYKYNIEYSSISVVNDWLKNTLNSLGKVFLLRPRRRYWTLSFYV